MPDSPTLTTPRSLDDISGWLTWVDQRMFAFFLREAEPDPGVVIELGVYLGKSAVFIGEHLGPDERFVVCDTFNSVSTDDANQAEMRREYPHLTLAQFEHNYRALRGDLPEVVVGLSSTITDHVEPAAARFIHIDASHLYSHVLVDLESAQKLLRDDGIVVFDDYRSAHTPGVAAVVWGAVSEGRLRPICLTPSKFYGTFGDPRPGQRALQRWLDQTNNLNCEAQDIAGRTVIRVWPTLTPTEKLLASMLRTKWIHRLRRRSA